MRVLIVFIPFVLMLVLWRRRIGDWRELFLIAAIVWGTLAITITELLSRFNGIAPGRLIAAWCIGAILVTTATPLVPRLSATPLAHSPKRDGRFRLMLAGILVIVLTCGLVAWIGPPNNWDSMTYHLVRVIHWIQNGNVAFYPTCMPSQLELPPGAEYILLHLQLLSGGDRLANLVQWFAFAGGVVGVSNVARLLGAGRHGQILAALAAATLPSACLEAVTTQGDLVTAFWLVCFIWLMLRLWQRPGGALPWPQWFCFLLAGLSAGLALITRAPSYIYVAPFALGLIAIALAQYRWRAIAPLLAAVVLALALNFPMYARNYRFTHTLLGNPGNRIPYVNARLGVGPTLANMVRNIALEMILPWKSARLLDEQAASAVLNLLGPPDSGSLTMPFAIAKLQWNSEDTAGNPLHVLLLAAALVTLALAARRGHLPLWLYAAGVMFGFTGFCAYVRWQMFHSRLLLPLLIMASPLVGVVMERWWKPRWSCLLPICRTRHPASGNDNSLARQHGYTALTLPRVLFCHA